MLSAIRGQIRGRFPPADPLIEIRLRTKKIHLFFELAFKAPKARKNDSQGSQKTIKADTEIHDFAILSL